MILINNTSNSQNCIDKIYTSTNDTIICQITLVNNLNIFYTSKKNKSTFIPRNKVANFVLNNKDVLVLDDLSKKDSTSINSSNETLNLKDQEDAYLNPNTYIVKLLSSYKLSKGAFDEISLWHKIILYKIDSSDLIKASPKRSLYVILKNDPFNTRVPAKIFKITNDSIVYLTRRIKKEVNFYAIPKKEIKYIGVESQKSYTMRVLLVISTLIIFPATPITIPLIIIHNNRVSYIKEYNIENEWKLLLNKSNISKLKK